MADIIVTVSPNVVSPHFDFDLNARAAPPHIMNRMFISSNMTQLYIIIFYDGLDTKKKYDIE